MKILKYIFLFLFISSLGYSQNVKITDFDITTSTAKQAIVNGSWSWDQFDYSNREVPDSLIPPKTISQIYRIDALYNQFYSSPSYAWNLGLRGAIFGNNADSVTLTPTYSYNFDADVSKYLSKDKGFFVNGAVSSSFLRQQEFLPYDSSENRPQLDLFAGLGYGRQVNATPLAKAISIDQELKKSGVTTKYLPKQSTLDISHIIDKESEYRTKYKQFESVLFENYEGSINYSFTNPRYYGGDIRLGVNFTVLTRNSIIEKPNPSLEARGRYGYPIGLNHQILASFQLGTPFDSAFGKLWTGLGRLDYWYNMTNRIRFNAGYAVNLKQFVNQTWVPQTGGGFKLQTNSSDFSYANHEIKAGFLFYLENYISLQLGAGYVFTKNQNSHLTSNAALSFILF
ncbi:MAG: hypothetical protein IPJ45_02455 [Ignavibacteria bacterium]|nr:hypothetical protein [Ignavibacteria bacterium]